MSKAGFGEHLKREREMRGVSLEEICAATRISTRFLEALESETWDQLPGGVFNRGFVRAVARFLGLDEDGLVAECAEAMKQSGVAIEGPSPHGARLGPNSAGEGRRLLWIGAVAIVLIVAAAWLGWRWFAARRAERNAAPPVAAAMPPGGGSDPAGGPAAPSAAASAAPEPADGSSDTQPASDMLQLKIEAGKATALTVTADGATVFDGSVIAGQNRSFEAEIEFTVTVEDAGAILMELNGQTLPPAGPPGQSGNVTLSRRDLKPAGVSH